MFYILEITTVVNSYFNKSVVILNHELCVELVSNLTYSWKEEVSEVEVILMKDIEYGNVIGIYNIHLKYCLRCKTNKEKLLYLIVSLISNNQFFLL